MDYLTCIQSFQTVIKIGSFAKAAESLHTTQSTISKRINWLESRLSTKLIERTTRELNITEAGKIFLQRSQDLISLWQEIENNLHTQGTEPSGFLNIKASSTSSSSFILPMTCKFLTQYPNVKINYTVHNHYLDLIQDQTDIYITTLFIPTTKLTIRETLISLNSQIIASPEYLKNHGTPKSIEDLKKHNCLIYAFADEPYFWQFSNGQTIEIDGNFQTNTFKVIIEMALQGVGLAFIPSAFVQKQLKEKQLEIILPEHQATYYQLYAYSHRMARKQSLARLYLDSIKKSLH